MSGSEDHYNPPNATFLKVTLRNLQWLNRGLNAAVRVQGYEYFADKVDRRRLARFTSGISILDD